MVSYRRNRLAGGTYFFTVVLHNRNSDLLIQYINALKESLNKIKLRFPFKTKAFVILPDHLHVIWQLPPGDSNYQTRWQLIKSDFTNTLSKQNVKIKIWQARYWEHTIHSEADFENHFNYIHYNPVKHALVQRVADWPHSSFHNYVRKGVLPIDWGAHHLEKTGLFGE